MQLARFTTDIRGCTDNSTRTSVILRISKRMAARTVRPGIVVCFMYSQVELLRKSRFDIFFIFLMLSIIMKTAPKRGGGTKDNLCSPREKVGGGKCPPSPPHRSHWRSIYLIQSNLSDFPGRESIVVVRKIYFEI